MKPKVIYTAVARMWIEEGILFGEYAPQSEVDLGLAREAVEARLKLSDGKSYPFLVDIRGLKSMSKEARVYLANEGAEGIIASALITGNAFTRTFAHLFLTINKPKVPIRLFGDWEDARKWLRQFVR
jgi:hypothetical protein